MNLKTLAAKYRFFLVSAYKICDPIRSPFIVIAVFHSFTIASARRSFQVIKLKQGELLIDLKNRDLNVEIRTVDQKIIGAPFETE